MSGSAKYLRPVDGVAGGIPYFRVGTGSPMVFLAPLAESFGGRQRRYQVRYLKPLLRCSTIYVIGGVPALPAGATLAEIAARYAGAVTELIAEPVDVMGANSPCRYWSSPAGRTPAMTTRTAGTSPCGRRADGSWNSTRGITAWLPTAASGRR